MLRASAPIPIDSITYVLPFQSAGGHGIVEAWDAATKDTRKNVSARH